MKNVLWFVMDIDGTLTDGTLEYSSDGVDRKRFHAADGLGIVMARACGFRIAAISGRTSLSAHKRLTELKVDRIFEGIGDKALVLRVLLSDEGLAPDQVAYIGDDINDLPAFDVAGVRFAVGDASEILKRKADHVTVRNGGRGAVREAIETILKAQGRLDEAVEAYLNASHAGPRQ